MSKDLKQGLLDLKAQQELGDTMYCPRCGRESMDAVVYRNALSRHADLYICNDCGTAEAMLDMMRNPLPLDQWAAFNAPQPQLDFKALPTAEVMGRVVNKHIPELSSIFKAWERKEKGDDFRIYQNLAYNACPGLLELRKSPFCAVYQAKDGRVLLRFKQEDNNVQVAIDRIT